MEKWGSRPQYTAGPVLGLLVGFIIMVSTDRAGWWGHSFRHPYPDLIVFGCGAIGWGFQALLSRPRT